MRPPKRSHVGWSWAGAVHHHPREPGCSRSWKGGGGKRGGKRAAREGKDQEANNMLRAEPCKLKQA